MSQDHHHPGDRIAVTARVVVTCVGRGRDAHVAAMREGRTGLTECDFPAVDVPCHVGRVAGIEDEAFPAGLKTYDNRATRLAVAALATEEFHGEVAVARQRWGPSRVGIVLGTSTSGIERLEQVYRMRRDGAPLARSYSMRHHNDYHAVTSFLIEHLALEGPGYTVSTACSSSAKAIVDAMQLIRAGLCDAVLVGGVDSLCLTSLYGFDALELVSREPCRPFDSARDGLTIGEGAAFMLLERERSGPRVSGYGESSDAVSMSTPPEDGAGAASAMRQALRRSQLGAGEVDFIKLHGTATPANDSAEAAAVASVFGPSVRAASLKGLIGHTLGAAGAVETVMCLHAMEAGFLPGSARFGTPDPALAIGVLGQSEPRAIRHVLCNAFGFGGSNCALVLSQS